MSLIAANPLFFFYTSAAFLIFILALFWGSEFKITGASLVLASIILSNIIYRLTAMGAVTVDFLNLIYALVDLFLVWVFLKIFRNPITYERKYWAAVLAGLHVIMLTVNLAGAFDPRPSYSPIYGITLNALTLGVLAACLIAFLPKTRDELIGVLSIKWLYFKADIFEKWLKFARKKAIGPMQRKTKSVTADIDKKIGQRVRQARLMRERSREDVAKFLGVSAAQVHKYETGDNRLSASALLRLAKFLEADVNFFYKGVEVELPPISPVPAPKD